MKKQKYTNQELLDIANKMWVGNKDIMALCGCGQNKAVEIRHQIEQQILKEGKLLPGNKVVPTKRVLKNFGINIKDLEETVLRELRIKNASAPTDAK